MDEVGTREHYYNYNIFLNLCYLLEILLVICTNVTHGTHQITQKPQNKYKIVNIIVSERPLTVFS